MKPKRRRLHIPQYEFGFIPETFTLIQETTLDGERLAREQARTEEVRHQAEAAQPPLFTQARSKTVNAAETMTN